MQFYSEHIWNELVYDTLVNDVLSNSRHDSEHPASNKCEISFEFAYLGASSSSCPMFWICVVVYLHARS